MGDASIEKAVDPKVATIRSYIQLVRSKLRDYPELNRLIEGVETSDRQIAAALFETLEDYNSTPPLIAPAALQGFPSSDLLVNGTICAVLESVGILQTRNQMNYTDGQTQVSVNDKTPLLMSWINIFRNRYESKKKGLKMAINLQTALGNPTGVSSEYLHLDGLFNDDGSMG